LDWAALLQRTFGNDVLQCSCGGRRRIVAFIVDTKQAVEILERLGLRDSPSPRAQSPPLAS
jgi:hypothetical protein